MARQFTFIASSHVVAKIRRLCTAVLLTFAAAGIVLPMSGCSTSRSKTSSQTAPNHGLMMSAIDRSVDPRVDLYQFANGKWLSTAKVQPNHVSAGVIAELTDRRDQVLHDIAERAAADRSAAPNSPEGLVGALYRSGMDTPERDREGFKPLQPELNRIAAIHDRKSLIVEIAQLEQIGVPAGFEFSIQTYPLGPPVYMFSINSIKSVFHKSSETRENDQHARILLAQNVDHVSRVLSMLGSTDPSAEAHDVITIETQLASTRNRSLPSNHKDLPRAMTVSELDRITPGWDWNCFLSAYGSGHVSKVLVWNPAYVENLNHVVSRNSLRRWQHYLRWTVVNTYAGYLGSKVHQEYVRFHNEISHSRYVEPPRWIRLVDELMRNLRSPMGQLYTEQCFLPSSKSLAASMTKTIKHELHRRIECMTWLDTQTRNEMHSKLDQMKLKVGYPDKWPNYGGLRFNGRSYCANSIAVYRFLVQHIISRVDQPVSTLSWRTSATTVNAFYDPYSNSIEVPAAMLQPRLFDAGADDSANYGGIGTMIAHEMCHAFDSDGQRFNAFGKFHPEWAGLARINFAMHRKAIIEQYNALPPILGLRVNGERTADENFADIGGLKLAYDAFEEETRNQPKTIIDGFTPEQRFFIAFAQAHRDLETPDEQKRILKSGTHAPERYRVNCAAADTPEFFEAFGSTKYNKANAATVW